jgi:hypothetical protein
MLDFLQVQTVDQCQIIPWITDDRPAAEPDTFFPHIRQTQCGWAVFEDFRPMASQLYNAIIGTPQQTDEPWLAGQVEHDA